MQRSETRILTTHVGSLIRPPALRNLLRDKQAGQPVDEVVLLAELERAIRETIQQQIDIGLDIINDGEVGKTVSWSRYILERLGGFESISAKMRGMPKAVYGKDRKDFAQFYEEYDASSAGITGISQWAVTGPVHYKGQKEIQRDMTLLKAAIPQSSNIEIFFPAVSPASVAPEREDRHYTNPDECLFAIADALHEEYKAIVDAGFILQIDDSYFASYFDVMVPPQTLADYRKWAMKMIDAINHALRGIPENRVRFHVCWGSWNGPHSNDVQLKDIVDLMLTIKAAAYSIEMANPRHEHEWEVWQNTKLPDGKILLPGLISHCTNVVEHPDLVAQRIVRLAKLVGRENVIASTDCGFAQGPFIQRVHPTIQWAKLESLVEGARRASKTLWAR